jgi:filamentous hemagglutinin
VTPGGFGVYYEEGSISALVGEFATRPEADAVAADLMANPVAPGGGLVAHEAAGGHTLADHTGKTPAELAARLAAHPGLALASTLTDAATADRVVAETLANPTHATDVANWLAKGSGGHPKAALVQDCGRAVGQILRRGTAAPVGGAVVKVVLQRDGGRPEGYFVQTVRVER